MERKIKKEARYRRHKRVRAKIVGTAERPRLCVFRSNKHIYANLINDEKGQTLLTASDKEIKKIKSEEDKKMSGKIAISYKVGELIAQKALKNKIGKIIFDRGGYKYHGRVKALADGTRKGGLKF